MIEHVNYRFADRNFIGFINQVIVFTILQWCGQIVVQGRREHGLAECHILSHFPTMTAPVSGRVKHECRLFGKSQIVLGIVWMCQTIVELMYSLIVMKRDESSFKMYLWNTSAYADESSSVQVDGLIVAVPFIALP